MTLHVNVSHLPGLEYPDFSADGDNVPLVLDHCVVKTAKCSARAGSRRQRVNNEAIPTWVTMDPRVLVICLAEVTRLHSPRFRFIK